MVKKETTHKGINKEEEEEEFIDFLDEFLTTERVSNFYKSYIEAMEYKGKEGKKGKD